jgi:hypothetical protein
MLWAGSAWAADDADVLSNDMPVITKVLDPINNYGKPGGLKASFNPDTYTITVTGKEKDVTDLLRVHVDNEKLLLNTGKKMKIDWQATLTCTDADKLANKPEYPNQHERRTLILLSETGGCSLDITGGLIHLSGGKAPTNGYENWPHMIYITKNMETTISGGTLEMLLDDGAAIADEGHANITESKITINGGKIYAPYGFAVAAISVDIKNPADVTGIVQSMKVKEIPPKSPDLDPWSDDPNARPTYIRDSKLEVYGDVETRTAMNDLNQPEGGKDYHYDIATVTLNVKKGASLTLGANAAITRRTTTLTIESGGELTVGGGATLNISGTLTNAGRVINKGKINNTGTIVNTADGKYYQAEGASGSGLPVGEVLPYLTVMRKPSLKGVSLTVAANGQLISDDIPFLVSLDLQSADAPLGPFVVVSKEGALDSAADAPTDAPLRPFVVKSKGSALDINVNKLKDRDRKKAPVEAGLYLISFESEDGYYVGATTEPIHLPSTDVLKVTSTDLKSGDKGVRLIVDVNDQPISDDIKFLVSLTSADDAGADAPIEPVVVVEVESKEGALDIDVNNLKDRDKNKVSIETGSYLISFESEDGYYYADENEMPEPIHLQGTDAAQESGGGGCNAGYGLFGLLLAGLVTRKYRKA